MANSEGENGNQQQRERDKNLAIKVRMLAIETADIMKSK
jgi:hypothetical protein